MWFWRVLSRSGNILFELSRRIDDKLGWGTRIEEVRFMHALWCDINPSGIEIAKLRLSIKTPHIDPQQIFIHQTN
jgi:hypothetical protein